MQLFLFTVDPRFGREVVAAGAAGIVVDWERRGKARRQAGEGTQINADTPADLARMRAATDGRLLCRVNAAGPWTGAEVDAAVALGADEVLLPMVRTPEQVDRMLDLVAGRCDLGILVETQDAVVRVADFAARPLSRIYVGLNDLRIDRGSDNLFLPLVDGTVDAVRAAVPGPFGVGGLTLPGGGAPVPGDLLAAELVRLGADFTFLRRSFTADMAGRDPAVEVPRLLASLDRLRRADPAEVVDDRARFVASVLATRAGGRVATAAPAPAVPVAASA
ncbi:aldolase/citrate lyase family protein [Geodermatophilus sp. YIM 151500]|uniref:aldolase/citrate lyase family protein n=1 Tax=Geodermatophilus sp. YIM 151500 TaxID=2984531 RepID=UPI0021E43D9F|nr:aldolase/citrate lyase family protein [Geodermatophilus sp. YIM 151500]MCV2488171.1 aldolase/citrate lyase family protein [Geodermatophilus sp. YIM 151500]